MSDLRKKLIRLAHEKPELREDLLPLLSKDAGGYLNIDNLSKEGRKAYHRLTGEYMDMIKAELDAAVEGLAFRKAQEFVRKNSLPVDPRKLADTISAKTSLSMKAAPNGTHELFYDYLKELYGDRFTNRGW